MSKKNKLTPMMQQYYEIKAKHPDFVLFFRLGDFYEMFDEDAEVTSRILNIALTQRSNQKMCGIPHHALDNYLYKMVKAGKKVAMCEQVEEPGKNKIVRREVVELVTPGTFTDAKHLKHNQDSFLTAIHVENESVCITACDASTGKFWLMSEKRDPERIASMLGLIQPSEIIVAKIPQDLEKVLKPYYCTMIPDYYFAPAINETMLLDHFQVGTLKGIGLADGVAAGAAGAVLRYLRDNLFKEIRHIDRIRFIRPESFLYLPETTLKNLEILEPLFTSSLDTSLFSNMNQTRTAMGAREFRNWLVYPLMEKELIEKRQKQVGYFLDEKNVLKEVREVLGKIPDLERILSRISLGKAKPKEVISFKNGLKQIEKAKEFNSMPFDELEALVALQGIVTHLEMHLEEEPPASFEDGGVIKSGVDAQLDEYRAIATHGKEILLKIEADEREKTGIQKLKLRYNKVIGYYLEVSKANTNKVPEHYIRKQSLVNSERYTIDGLVEYETKIMNARSSLSEIERRIFQENLDFIVEALKELRQNIEWIKKVDIIAGLAQVAAERNFVCPSIRNDYTIKIEEGRHPVVETFTEQFIANSVELDDKDNRMILLTGPNMAGKSTYLRQVALITLLAHVGSFVPAKKAEIALTDQIFTRIGASDNLAGGESTFLVEMSETSQILRNATSRSLIIMDEVGRGTSTYDGLSLAWGIVEHLSEWDLNRGRTLFATHYHELTVLGQERGIQNCRMSVREWNDEIIFLHKVEEGAADKSYGIHVAEIAGIPKEVIGRAKEILSSMEVQLLSQEKTLLKADDSVPADGESLFAVKEDRFAKVKSQILGMELNHTTPMQALLMLEEIQQELRKKK